MTASPPSITDVLVANHLGDWASVAALFISLIGFGTTWFTIFRTNRTIARAVKDTRDNIKLLDTISEFASAISTIDEIKRLHRAGAWPILPDRYSSLRRLLVDLRIAEPRLTDAQKTVIQSAIQTLSDLEQKVEKSLVNPTSLDIPKFNLAVSQHADSLRETVLQLRDTIGGDHGTK